MKTAIIVPCYNEAERLSPGAFLAALKAQPTLHFWFVNDGSRDATLEVLTRLQNDAPDGRVAIVDLKANSGKAEAVRRGMLEALALPEVAYAGYWDADRATPLDEIPTFVKELLARPEIDLVMGARVRLLGRKIDRKFYRHAYGRAFATVVSEVVGMPVCDTQCGAKLFRANSITRSLFEDEFMSRWVFDVELLARLAIALRGQGLDPAERVVEKPLRRWTDVPGSKVGVRDALFAVYEIARIERRYGRRLRGR